MLSSAAAQSGTPRLVAQGFSLGSPWVIGSSEKGALAPGVCSPQPHPKSVILSNAKNLCILPFFASPHKRCHFDRTLSKAEGAAEKPPYSFSSIPPQPCHPERRFAAPREPQPKDLPPSPYSHAARPFQPQISTLGVPHLDFEIWERKKPTSRAFAFAVAVAFAFLVFHSRRESASVVAFLPHHPRRASVSTLATALSCWSFRRNLHLPTPEIPLPNTPTRKSILSATEWISTKPPKPLKKKGASFSSRPFCHFSGLIANEDDQESLPFVQGGVERSLNLFPSPLSVKGQDAEV